jgi:hypothetical protein
MIPTVPSQIPKKTKAKGRNSSKVSNPDLLISVAFFIIIIGIAFSFLSEVSSPPEVDDFEDGSEPTYEEALEDHEAQKRAYDGIYFLFSSVGTVILAGGLFFKATGDSEHLPDWARTALIAGTMWFLVRLFTTELSLFETVTLLALL